MSEPCNTGDGGAGGGDKKRKKLIQRKVGFYFSKTGK